MAFQLRRRVAEIDTGHRLMNHAGKCGSDHGHRYVIELLVTGTETDEVGVVVDFSVLKAKLGTWLDEHWDHTKILERGDPLIASGYGCYGNLTTDEAEVLASPKAGLQYPEADSAIGEGKRPCFVLPYAPSAENLARFLYTEVCPFVFKAELAAGLFQIDSVVVWETPNCACIYPSPMVVKPVQKAVSASTEEPPVRPTHHTMRTPEWGVAQVRSAMCCERGGWMLLKLDAEGDPFLHRGKHTYHYIEPDPHPQTGHPYWSEESIEDTASFGHLITGSHIRALVKAGTLPPDTLTKTNLGD